MTTASLPADITLQIQQACALIEQHCADSLLAIHLYGSALDGGLKPLSDIDLLVTLDTSPTEATRQALMRDLLSHSAAPGAKPACRALEITVLVLDDIVPWRHPARRILQFGEWLRDDLLQNIFEPPLFDPDLAILLTQARQHSVALRGPAAHDLFDPVPAADFRQALRDTLQQWQTPDDWAGDERNIVLALARIWYSASTGQIAPKDVAAQWAMTQAAAEHQAVFQAARLSYLGQAEDTLSGRASELSSFIAYTKGQAQLLLA